MHRRRFLVLALTVPLFAAAPRAARAAAQTYRTRGTVRYIAKDRTRVRIRHDDIPGFMKAMTMPFDVTPSLLAGVAEGDHVTFTFEARDDGSCVILALARVAAPGASAAPHGCGDRLSKMRIHPDALGAPATQAVRLPPSAHRMRARRDEGGAGTSAAPRAVDVRRRDDRPERARADAPSRPHLLA